MPQAAAARGRSAVLALQLFALCACARLATIRADDLYEPCPALPDASWATPATVMADSRWQVTHGRRGRHATAAALAIACRCTHN